MNFKNLYRRSRGVKSILDSNFSNNEKIKILAEFLKNHEINELEILLEDLEGYIKNDFFSQLDNLPLKNKNEAYEILLRNLKKLYLISNFPELAKKNVIGIVNRDIQWRLKLYSEIIREKIAKGIFNNSRLNYFIESGEKIENFVINELEQKFTQTDSQLNKYFDLQRGNKLDLNFFIKYIYIFRKKFPFKNSIINFIANNNIFENTEVYDSLIINISEKEELKNYLSTLEKFNFSGEIGIYSEKLDKKIIQEHVSKTGWKIILINNFLELEKFIRERDKLKKSLHPSDYFKETFEILFQEIKDSKKEAKISLKNLEHLKLFIDDQFKKNSLEFENQLENLEEAKQDMENLKYVFYNRLEPVVNYLVKSGKYDFMEKNNAPERVQNLSPRKKIDKLNDSIKKSLSNLNFSQVEENLKNRDYSKALFYLKQLYLRDNNLEYLKKIGEIYYHLENKVEPAMLYFDKFVEKGGTLSEDWVNLLAELYYKKKKYNSIITLSKHFSTPLLSFFTGLIYENGYGNNMINHEKALSFYKKASSLEKGRKNYDRLYRILYQQRERVKENTKTKIIEHKVEKKSLCFITTAVCLSFDKKDDCHELRTFRDFRDNWLIYQVGGAEEIAEYYKKAPLIIEKIDRAIDSKNIYKDIWNNYLKDCYYFILKEKYQVARELYKNMIYDLIEKWY